MQGTKYVFQVLFVAILITVLNFYKNVFKRDREMREAMAMKNKLDIDAANEKTASAIEMIANVPNETVRNAYTRHHADQWLEYHDKCNAVHIFLIRPDKKSISESAQFESVIDVNGNHLLVNTDHQTSNKSSISHEADVENKGKCENFVSSDTSNRKTNEGQDCVRNSVIDSTKIRSHANKVMDKNKLTGTAKESSGIIVYVFLILLIASLIKATLDMTKYLREKRENAGKDDLSRRCSLQQYSQVRRQNAEQCKRKSFSKIQSLVPQSSVDSSCNNPTIKEQTRRMSTNLQDYKNGSGIPTEPGSPAKPGKLLAGRPAPLLRRCSVPAFGKQMCSGKIGGIPRRPSMDSVSEDDSSPDVKRRVRLLHRH